MKRILISLLFALACFAPAAAQQVLTGTGGALYLPTQPDRQFVSSNVVTATTTQLISAVTGQNTYLYILAAESSGTNSAATVEFVYSPNAGCTSSNTIILGGGVVPLGAAVYNWISVIGFNVNFSNTIGAPLPASIPYIVPAGNYTCAITAGTTISAWLVAWYAQHPN